MDTVTMDEPMVEMVEADESVQEVDQDVVAQHGPFTLRSTEVTWEGEPTLEQWQAAVEWCQRVEKASPFWVGDLLVFGDRFGEMKSQVLDATGYAWKTCLNAQTVAAAIPPERRHPNVPFSHHAEVAALPPEDQDTWLQACEDEDLTREQLRVRLKTAKASSVGQTVELWVMVRCTDVADQEALADRMRLEGRSVRLSAKEV